MAPSLDKNKNNCINPCGYKTMTGIIETGGMVKKVTARLYCKRWKCPYCGPRQAWYYQQRISEKAIEFKLDRFMTLTLDPRNIKGDPYKHLNESWRKLREAFRRKFGKSISYIAVTEAHKSGIPHKHILIDHYINQKWLSTKWDRLGGGRMVDIRKIKDIKNMARYVGKYLTKDVLISAPKGTRRITTSQNIKLREKVTEGTWSVSDADLETLLDLQKSSAKNVLTDKNGRLRSFEVISLIDLTHWGVPNDRLEIEKGDREKFPEFSDDWVLIAKYEKEEQQNETSSSVCSGIEQRATDWWLFNSGATNPLGGLLPGAWVRNCPLVRGCGNRQARGPHLIRGNAGLPAQIRHLFDLAG